MSAFHHERNDVCRLLLENEVRIKANDAELEPTKNDPLMAARSSISR
jgi:hypothetical protein